jgi:CheY-like chemotaxis protein
MPAAVLARATEPFFSTKPSHLGTGLGLSIVSDTMQRHGGRLELASQPGRGTDATLWLPVVAPTTDAAPASATPAVAALATKLELLLVEDEPALRDATERILRHLGHRVTSVEGVADALQWLEGGGAPDLIVSDIMMPDATGIDLLHTIRARGRKTPVLLVSGFAVENIADELDRHTGVAFLPKPWTIREMQESMRALLASVVE